MCMACEMGFWSMIDALPPEVRERILREQEEAARFACDAPAQAAASRCSVRGATRCGRAQAVSELTSLTLAEARDGLKKKSFSAAELAAAHLAAIEQARALNAFVLETPERAGDMAKASDARIASGEARPARRHSAGDQGHVLYARRALHRLFAHPRQFRADL